MRDAATYRGARKRLAKAVRVIWGQVPVRRITTGGKSFLALKAVVGGLPLRPDPHGRPGRYLEPLVREGQILPPDAQDRPALAGLMEMVSSTILRRNRRVRAP